MDFTAEALTPGKKLQNNGHRWYANAHHRMARL